MSPGAHHYAEPSVRAGGYIFHTAPSADLAPAADAPHIPKPVRAAATAFRRELEALQPLGVALRNARAALPGAHFRGQGPDAEQAAQAAKPLGRTVAVAAGRPPPTPARRTSTRHARAMSDTSPSTQEKHPGGRPKKTDRDARSVSETVTEKPLPTPKRFPRPSPSRPPKRL